MIKFNEMHFIFPTIISNIKKELEKATKGLYMPGIRFSAPVQMRINFIHALAGALRWGEPMCEL